MSVSPFGSIGVQHKGLSFHHQHIFSVISVRFPFDWRKLAFWWGALPVALHVLGVDDVQVLCIDQLGKQTGPERGCKNNRQCVKLSVRGDVQRSGCAVMSKSCLVFIVVAISCSYSLSKCCSLVLLLRQSHLLSLYFPPSCLITCPALMPCTCALSHPQQSF